MKNKVKKLLAGLLSVTMLMTTMVQGVLAASNHEENNDIPGWTWTDSDNATATRVWENGNWVAKLSFAGSEKVPYFFTYNFSDKAVSGHTYKVSADLKIDAASQGYLFFGSNYDCKVSNTSTDNYKTWKNVSFNTSNHMRVRIGLDAKVNAIIYVDNVVVTDVTDSANPVVVDIYNGDFEECTAFSINFEGNDGGEAVATVISRNDEYDINLIWATYSTDENGTKTMRNINMSTDKIYALEDVQTFKVVPEFEAGCNAKAFIWKSGFVPMAQGVEFLVVDAE